MTAYEDHRDHVSEGREIVVGVDDSPCSDAALKWAASAAVLHQTSLTLVHAAAPPAALLFPFATSGAPFADWQRRIGGEILRDAEREAKKLTDGSVRVSTDLQVAAPGSVLIDWSRHARMVVVGNRGRGAVARAVLGSVSTALVHRAHCPVVVVHDEATAPPQNRAVLLGFDGSPSSELAADLAFDEASRRGVELTVLHAWWSTGAYEFPGLDWDDLQSDVDRDLAGQLSKWQQRHPEVRVRRVVVRDQPGHRLIEHSASAQLIVVGSHGEGAVAGVLLGSVSAVVIQAARIPVMVARRD